MHRNPLFNLFARNRHVARPDAPPPPCFNLAPDGAAIDLFLYDFLVSSEADTEWFGGVAAETIVRQLVTLAAQGGPPVRLHINSPGGDVFAGRAIEAAIKMYPGKTTALVEGFAASAASLVAVAANETLMAPGAFMMIHQAWTITLGNATDHLAAAALLEKIDAGLVQSYATKAGDDSTDWPALLAAETWLTAQEALDLKLATGLIEDAPAARAAWDLSAYANAPSLFPRPPRAAPETAPPENSQPASAPPQPAAGAESSLSDTDEFNHRRRRVSALSLAA